MNRLAADGWKVGRIGRNLRGRSRSPCIASGSTTLGFGIVRAECATRDGDRKDLLGHKSGDVTTDYSAAELMNLIKAANLLVRSKDSPTLTVLRLVT